jgi:Glyoxalase/Bleomycin resistance protein/Dioxygenase superfamily
MVTEHGPARARARCLSVAPTMPTTDMQRTVDCYERLGFSVTVFEGRGFAIAERDGIALHFSLSQHHDPARTAACVYIRVSDADALYEEWRASGLEKVAAPGDTDYRMHEGTYIDPDNNLVFYASPIADPGN